MEKFLEIIGAAGTGKGTLLRLAQALVGSRNTYVSSLRLLEQSRFETVNLLDKQLVVITDEERYTASVSTLKAITGEDTLRGERKFEKSFTFTNQCLVIVAANEAIQSPDYTSGLARRRLTVEFRHHPTKIRDLIHFDEDGEPAGELAPSLPGLLNWVLTLDETEMVDRLRECSSTALSDTKARMLVETNPLASWAQDYLIATNDPNEKTYVGLAQALPHGQGFEEEATRLYPSYRGYTQRANFKDVSLTRFSALLEDLCHYQLQMAQVEKHRDKDGVHLTGIRLRTHKDHNIGGFIDSATSSRRTMQEPVDSMKASTPDNADYVDYVDSSINDLPSPPYDRSSHVLEFPKKSTYPTESSLPRDQAYIEPSPPYTAHPDTTGKSPKPHQKREEWVYGKRQQQ